jgi:hypothetical protein
MKKAAIFVEGQTEFLFIRRFLEELAGSKNIIIYEQEFKGGKFISLSGVKTPGDQKYFVLIVDCHGDGSVKSAIIDRRPDLKKAKYDIVLGLRDLYPVPLSDLAKLVRGLRHGLPTAGLPTYICVAVQEIEAWFVQETNHYAIIDASLTKEAIKTNFHFDLDVDCAETITRPSVFLHDIYKFANKKYSKKLSSTARTVSALDYDNLYFNLRFRLPSLLQFVTHIDGFLT